MSASGVESASGSIDGNTFFDHLPVPCVYLTDDHRIAFSNAAARSIIGVSNNDSKSSDSTFSSWPSDHSIFDTSFSNEQLAGPVELQHGLTKLEAQFAEWNESNNDEGDRDDGHKSKKKKTKKCAEPAQAVKLRPAATSSWEWTLTRCTIAGRDYFCLTASEVPSQQSWKGISMDADEEHAFLQSLVAPSWQDVPYAAGLMSADKNTYSVNNLGHQQMSDLATTLEHEDPSQRYPNMWDKHFTARKELPEAAGPTCLKHGQGILSLLRGIENPRDGSRQIVETTCTLLNNPFTDKPLGVLVQAQDLQDWANYLLRQDLYNRPSWTTAGEHPSMVRTILSNGCLDYFSDSWQDFSGIKPTYRSASETPWLCSYPDTRRCVGYNHSSSL